jgi:hypothetical protein
MCIALLLAVTGCDIEWGGADFRLENPAPEPPPEVTAGVQMEVPPAPLPDGPLLFAVRVDPSDGASRAFPIARLVEDGLAALGLPESPDTTWSARFDSAFLAPGRELELHAAGRRIGSLVLDGSSTTPSEACLPVATGQALVPIGSAAPAWAFAFASGAGPDDPSRFPVDALDNRMRTYSPILAEQLMRSGGESRPYLAQRADQRVVSWPGDSTRAFAATYLIADQLDAPPPDGQAVSLFFVARFRPQGGYVPVWSEFRRYGSGSGKEVFTYLDAADGPAGRIDFVELRDGSGEIRIAASVDRGETRTLDWTEEGECRAELMLGTVVSP